MRIAFLRNRKDINFFNVQGATAVYYLFKYLKESGDYRVRLFSKLPPEELSKNTDNYFSLHSRSIFSYLFRILQSLTVLKDFDLIYGYKENLLIPLLAKFLFKQKIVYDSTGAPPVEQAYDFSKRAGILSIFKKIYLSVKFHLYKILLPRCELVIVHEKVKNWLINRYNVPKNKIHTRPQGVDLERFNPAKYRDEPFDKENPSIVCVSSVGGKWRAKGIETVLNGLKILKNEGVKASLNIVGSIPESTVNYLKNFAVERGVGGFLKFEGYIPHREIPRVLSKYDIAISPVPDLKSYRVASATKVFEYLAMKKLVIVSDVECNTQIIKDGYNGVVYRSNDPKNFASKMREVIENSEFRRKLRENTRKSVKKYDWHSIFSKLDEKLRKVISEG